MTRQQHFWGTCPAADVATAQALMIDNSPDAPLTSVSDGELDNLDWVTTECARRAELPELVTLRRSRIGAPYTTMHPLWHPPIYALRPGSTMPVDKLNTGYADRAAIGASTLALRAAVVRPALQISVPGPPDLAALNWGSLATRYYWAEVASLLREIRAIVAQQTVTGLIFQLEIPVPTYLVARTPVQYQERVAARLSKGITDFIRQTPAGTVWIVHPCDSDPHGKPLVSPTTARPYVTLINAIWASWPHDTHRLDAVGIPMGNGATPAPTSMDFYWALSTLGTPREVRVIAGIAQVGEGHTLARQTQGLHTAEAVYGGELVVAAPCGFGRRPDAVPALLERQRELAGLPPSTCRWV